MQHDTTANVRQPSGTGYYDEPELPIEQRQRARDLAARYAGEFPFMDAMHKRATTGRTPNWLPTSGQARSILRCANRSPREFQPRRE